MKDKIKVLLVEDNDGDIELTTTLLEESELRFDVNYVKNGHDALAYIYKRKDKVSALPHIIFLDINMPAMDGFEVLQQLVSYNILPPIAFFMLTSSTTKNEIARAKQLGAHGYFAKGCAFDIPTIAYHAAKIRYHRAQWIESLH